MLHRCFPEIFIKPQSLFKRLSVSPQSPARHINIITMWFQFLFILGGYNGWYTFGDKSHLNQLQTKLIYTIFIKNTDRLQVVWTLSAKNASIFFNNPTMGNVSETPIPQTAKLQDCDLCSYSLPRKPEFWIFLTSFFSHNRKNFELSKNSSE